MSCIGVKLQTYQTPESKKEEFRKYLEKSGVIDALTKVLVGLYEEPERPPNAVDYIKRYDHDVMVRVEAGLRLSVGVSRGRTWGQQLSRPRVMHCCLVCTLRQVNAVLMVMV